MSRTIVAILKWGVGGRLVTLGLLSIVIGLAGCGGDDSAQDAGAEADADRIDRPVDPGGDDGGPDATVDAQPSEASDKLEQSLAETHGAEIEGEQADPLAAVVHRYNVAIARRDGVAACGLMTIRMRRQFERFSEGPPREKCSDVARETFGNMAPADANRLREAQVTSVRLKGDQGYVTMLVDEQKEQSVSYSVERVNGTWKVAPLGASE